MSHFDYHTLRLENTVLAISWMLTDDIDKARNYTRYSLKSRHKLTLTSYNFTGPDQRYKEAKRLTQKSHRG